MSSGHPNGTTIDDDIYELNVVPDDAIDITDDIKVYEKGKTVKCPNCGSGIGMKFHERVVKCYSCMTDLYDLEWDEREDQKPRGQQSIERWM